MLSNVIMFKGKHFLYSMAHKASQPIYLAQPKDLFIFLNYFLIRKKESVREQAHEREQE